jgi:hypothetical protein
MDTDADGLIKGKEFRGISESGMFHVRPGAAWLHGAQASIVVHSHWLAGSGWPLADPLVVHLHSRAFDVNAA